jgi:5-methylcytosine-specific restriction endonuclease McrA
MALPGPRRSRCRQHQRVVDRKRNARPGRQMYQDPVWRSYVVEGKPCYLQIPGICTGTAEVRDHIVPIALGGTNTADNIGAACRACNGSKGAKTAEELRTRATPRRR